MDLQSAYTAARYRVSADPQFTLRVGEPSAALDALLDRHGADTWAFVTACNPGSVRLSSAENAERMVQLREMLLDFVTYPGESSDPAGDWAEPSLLMVGLDPVRAATLGRHFGQNAILTGVRGGPTELVWLVAPV